MSGRWWTLLTVNYNRLALLTNLPTLCPLMYPHWADFTRSATAAAIYKKKWSKQKQHLSFSHICADPHMHASQQRRSVSSPEGTTGLHCHNLQMGKGWTPPAAHWSWHTTLPQHSLLSYLANCTKPWYHGAMTEFSKMYWLQFLLLLPPPTQFGLVILRQLGFTYRGNTNSFPAK